MQQQVINPSIFIARRKRLAKQLEHGIFILRAKLAQERALDVTWPYEQSNNFYYLTGFTEPNSALLIEIVNGKITNEILFCQEQNAQAQLWTGQVIGTKQAAQQFGFTTCLPITRFASEAKLRISAHQRIYYSLANDGRADEFDHLLLHTIAALRKNSRFQNQSAKTITDPTYGLGLLRQIKDKQEIAALTAACALSADATKDLWQKLPSFARPLNECQLHAHYLSYYLTHGHGASTSFSPIVAGGKNSLVLHYEHNNQPIDLASWVLVDTGAKLGHYCGDITRYLPCSAKACQHTPTKIVYQIVQQAKNEAIELCKPGIPIAKIINKVHRCLSTNLIDAQIAKGSLDFVQAKVLPSVFPHSIGHWLGLDVHDPGNSFTSSTLAPNHVLTIEPGLYIRANTPNINPKFKNIGIRLEDDILITSKKAQNLTKNMPCDFETIVSVWD